MPISAYVNLVAHVGGRERTRLLQQRRVLGFDVVVGLSPQAACSNTRAGAEMLADIAARPAASTASPADLSDLTDREREVLTQVGGGLSNDEIAGRLFLSPLTAKTHVSRIMSKLSARDRAQLVVTAYETGLVRAGAQG
jgi:DNA-binding NarL/FixJ family response regulator